MSDIKILHKCPYFNNCLQQIKEDDLNICLGWLEEWNFKDCHKYKDLGKEEIRKRPIEWVKEKEKHDTD